MKVCEKFTNLGIILKKYMNLKAKYENLCVEISNHVIMHGIRGYSMKLFFKCLPRMIKMANRDLGRHFSLTFSSILSIGVALLIAMLMSVMALNVNQFTTNIESEFIVQISINPSLSQEEVDALENKIESMKNVQTITYSSKEAELNKLIQENGSVFSQYEGENNPLYDVFIVELKDNQGIDAFTKKMKKDQGVIDATYGGSAITTMAQMFSSMRYWGIAFILAMIVLAIFLIRNTIKMAIHVRKDEISIMRQVGAYSWYITFPFMFEGMVTGFLGALGPVILCLGGYAYLYHSMDGFFMSNMFVLLKPYPFTWIVSAILIAIGVLVGAFGSYLAVRKNLRWVR